MSKKFGGKKPLPPKSLNRKERRKEERKLKKARKNAFAHRNFNQVKTFKTIDTAYKAQCEQEKNERLKLKKAKKKDVKKEDEKKVEDARIQGLKLAIQRDDKELKQLEKNLNFRKKKGKSSLPTSFVNDGLDYIIDATDSEKIKSFEDVMPGYKEDDEDSKLGSDLEDMLEGDDESESEKSDDDREVKAYDPTAKASKSILKSKEKLKPKEKRSVIFSEPGVDEENDSDNFSDVKDSGSENEDSSNPEENDQIIDAGTDKSDSDDEKSGQRKSLKRKRDEVQEPELKEDIYGRLRDSQGNIVPFNQSATYIPPAKRALMAGGHNEALRKKLKGFLNRVSENTIQALSSQVEGLYLDHSRADMNETLTALITEATVSPVLSPERLVSEMVMLIAILHGNIGSEIGAHFLQEMGKQFEKLFLESDYGRGKSMENVLLIISNIYNFKMVHSRMIFDIMDKFVSAFGERDIELLLLMLKTVGFTLRKDDPVRLKQVILDIQTKAKSAETSSGEVLQSRIRFMLDILMAVRNNNMHKIPSYDPSHVEHLKKITKNFIRGQGLGEDQLNIGLEDLLKADQVGRWWIVGSAWEGRSSSTDIAKEAKSRTETSVVGTISSQMLKLAKKQGMNTDIRRHIFFILGSSEDFEDAFSRLLRLGLNRTQEREIIHVMLHCCLNEKEYNPFYAFLAQKFCSFDRRFMMTVQFSMWDKFKEMEKMDKSNRLKLAKFISHLLLTKSLSLSIFKVVEFGMEGKKMIRFLTQVLGDVVTCTQSNTMVEIFERIAPYAKLKALRQGLQVFMRIHLKSLKTKGTLSGQDLQDRIEMAESALFSSQASSML
ncbi:nucleolar MIF4G domain-containing protein 1-like [Elysia marginata]|uniref:Nucleolar MIF4G domain-containing protein 1-like n=1 Tax=Elysia marginata TaxID=1093978 RepID=A0AAV4IG33_9GAST|nr:nucleolar MIF4G domain-containing protein 1-like [Elysia marginata]